MSGFQPGYCELLSFMITSTVGDWAGGVGSAGPNTIRQGVEIRHLVQNFVITESMGYGSIRGNALIIDSIGLLENTSLIGEEAAKIVYKDALGTTQTDWMFIYAVSNINPSQTTNAKSYTISFTSLDKFIADTNIIRKSYKGPSSLIAQAIFDEYYGRTKPITIASSSDFRQYVIPAMTPEQALHFASRRAYSSESGSQGWRFFESRNSFFFADDEYLISGNLTTPIKFVYNPPAGQVAADPSWMQSIKSINIPRYVNTYKDMEGSQYNETHRLLDLATRFGVDTTHNYWPEALHYPAALDIQPMARHSGEFIDRFLTQRNPINIQYETGLSEETSWDSEIKRHKTATWKRMAENVLVCEIYGRNDLFAGDIVDINLDKWTADNTRSPTHISGRYFVYELTTRYSGMELEQTMTLTKPDWRRR